MPTPTDPGRQAKEARVLFPPSRKASSAEERQWLIPQSSRKPYQHQFLPNGNANANGSRDAG